MNEYTLDTILYSNSTDCGEGLIIPFDRIERFKAEILAASNNKKEENESKTPKKD